MCSIMGYTAKDIRLEDLTRGFEETVSRGPDMSRTVETPAGWLFFHRLAIMGLTEAGMQPFERDGSYVVCNGELYGFRPVKEALIRKGYTFRSDSDCEIILPLYREQGTAMFEKLDAEFAMILYDAETGSFIAARDPIGIRPLYYGYSETGHIMFASEPKNLVGLCCKVMPFPPGH
ncbi:MAG: asparagine synthetase B, partial [Hominenteromicrobium sp.]